jgi:uncharacterized protein (TIGR02145 family)
MRYYLIQIFISIVFVSCETGNLPPVAKLSAFPPVGDTSILFEFNANGSEDDRNYAIGLVYRWDLDGDEVWDTDYTPYKTMAYRYLQPGSYTISVEVKDLDGLVSIARDSVEVFGENLDIDTLYDSRDGNKYRIVKIMGLWWMAENIRYGTLIPSDREQTNNDTVERYRFYGKDIRDSVGGIYRWFEALNYQIKDPKGICPDGWHIPTNVEFERLFKSFPIQYTLQYYGKDGLSKLDLDLNNYGERWEDGYFWQYNSSRGSLWSSSFVTAENRYWPYIVEFGNQFSTFNSTFYECTGPENNCNFTRYQSVRCIRND